VKTAHLCGKHGISEKTLGFRDFQPALLDLPIVGGHHFLAISSFSAALSSMVGQQLVQLGVRALQPLLHVSERRACKVTGCVRITLRYRSRKPHDAELRGRSSILNLRSVSS
jgi:hypothetical protein